MTKHSPPVQAFTASELLAVMASRLLKDGQIVFAGIGIPLLAATLAQRNSAPHLTILFEGGTIGPFIVPGELPPSTNEQRCTRRSNMVLPITDVLLLLQRGYVDVGFMGGAQIDRFGNLNSSFIGDADNPKIRLPGTGGGNDISSLTDMIVAMKHEKRRFSCFMATIMLVREEMSLPPPVPGRRILGLSASPMNEELRLP